MADLFGTGIDLPDIETGQSRPAGLDGFIRVVSRNQKLIGRTNDGTEFDLSGNKYDANIFGSVNGPQDSLNIRSVVITTNATGDATFTYPQPYRILPAMTFTPVATSGTQVTIVEITAANATSVSIRTYRTRTQGVLLGGTVNPTERVSAQVVALFIGFLA